VVEEIVEKQRSDSLASEGAEDAEAEDIGDRGGQRVGRRKNVLILPVATHSGLDLGHDKTHDPSPKRGCEGEKSSVILGDFLIPFLGIFNGKAIFAKVL